VEIDVDRMLESAYDGSCTGGKEIPVAYTWDKDALKAWVASVAGDVDKDARNAKYQLKSGKIKVKGSANGRELDRVKARAAVRTAVRAALAAPDAKLVSSAFEVDTVKPKVTKKKLGKVLLVDLSQRKIRLYSKGKLEKTYRCAVGMRGYSTPTGSFKIVRKVKWPTWGNPGSAWAKNMPSYIGPGPSNPLGTRALYLNVSGIRIHGTSKRSSIGTAASHGCMRMLREDVEELYKKVPVGTKVHIVK
jgi:L,D-transpeptidase ErfK/SrfK